MSISRIPTRIRVSLTLLILGLGCLGCGSTMEINTDFDPQAHFSQYRTYAWQDPPPNEDPRLNSDLLHRRVENAVHDQMAAKGFTRAKLGEAQLHVTYHLAIGKEISAQTVHRDRAYRRGGWSETYVYQYQVGTLLVDLVEARSRQLLWRGAARDTVDESWTPEQRDAKIRQAVEGMFSRYPPGITKSPGSP